MLVFLFTDIEGSTRLWETHTDHMGQVIARHDAILQEQVEAHGGRITKHTGDGIFAVFDGGQPIACTLEAQKRFAAEPWPHIGELRIRVGLHAGEALFQPSAGTPQGDYFGPPVNMTARVMAAAWGGQILLTPEVTSVSPLPAGATLLDLGQHLLKNVTAPQQIYQLDHPQLAPRAFPPPHTLSGQSIRQAVAERGSQLSQLDPTSMVIELMVAVLVPVLQGELDPRSGALEGNLGVLDGMGAGTLRTFTAQFAARLRVRQQRGEVVGLPQIRGLLDQELQTQWQAGGETATALRTEASRLLQAVQGVEATMAAATGEVKEALARGLADLGGQFAEFRWMLAGVQQTLAEVRALQQEQLDLQRQQLVKIDLVLQRQQEQASVADTDVERALAPPDVPSSTQPRHNLPVQPTPFVGRREEMDQIAQRFEDPACRLLTVLGPGGMGKSRLAIQAAQEHLPLFKDGVWFVPLASLESVDLLASAILEALEIPRYGSADAQTQLLNYLRDRNLLMVLDGFEDLLEGSTLIAEVLARAPGVKVLVTSRERLNLRGEWLLPLQGMGVPEEETVIQALLEEGDVINQAVAVLEEYSAVGLFLQCARQVQPEFSLASAGPASVARICQLVEGMPLAIELAAPWMRVMDCEEIAEEIEGGLELLATSLRDVPERHRSIRAVFDHSWSLLSAEEREVLRQLSVFRGGFRRDAAEAVAGASLLVLSGLVDRSWIRRPSSGRYEVHELVRQYCRESLEENRAQADEVRDRHSHYYGAFLQEREERLQGREQAEAFSEILEEIDNVWAAWGWAVERGDVETMGRCVATIAYTGRVRRWYQEMMQAFDDAVLVLRQQLQLPAACLSPAARAQTALVLADILSRQSLLYGWRGDERAIQLCEESLALLEEVEPSTRRDSVTIHAKAILGQSLYRRGEGDRGLLQEALALSEATGNPRDREYVLSMSGNRARNEGRYAEAERCLQQAVAIANEAGEQYWEANSLNNLSWVAWAQGEYQRAQMAAEESLQIFDELGDPAGMGYCFVRLGEIATTLGEYESAAQHFERTLAVVDEFGGPFLHFETLRGQGILALALEQYAEARRLFGESLSIGRGIRQVGFACAALLGLGHAALGLGEGQEARECFCQALAGAMKVQSAYRALGAVMGMASVLTEEGDHQRAVELVALVLQHPATHQRDRDRAQDLLTQLESELSPDVLATAMAQGRARELEEVAAEILGSTDGE
jgi:predicted ATPase/class 3 adenylate cyclase